jgi:hypothetical protein
MFPDNELKPLPPEHPIWTASGKFAVRPDVFPLEGIQQGCKTVVVYSPRAISGYWETNQFQEGRSRTAFQLAANVIAYATGLEPPRPRLTEVEIDRTVNQREEIKRGYLKVAQLRHDGDWQPAPRAMRNLMLAGRNAGLDVLLETRPLHPRNEAILDFRFFYLHGRNQFAYTRDDLKHLRFVLENGGVLLADACCGSKSFDAAFRKLMEEMWSDRKLRLEPIPLNDELFSAELNGTAITRVKCRREAPDGARVGREFADVPPALEGVKVNGRWAVIYSRYDIGCALEKHASTDCLGHDHESAVRLGQAAVLYSLKR